MRTELRAAVDVEEIVLFAEMATLQPRPELGLLCRGADGGTLTEEGISRLLPGLSRAAARTLVRTCADLGLCDDRGVLTSLGREAGESQRVPLPEQGVYRLWVARHPLCGVRILHVERVSAEDRDEDYASLTPAPMDLPRRVPMRSVIDADRHFVLRDLPAPRGQAPRCRRLGQERCALVWRLDFLRSENSWCFEGKIDLGQGAIQVRHAAESIDGLDLPALFGAWAREQGLVGSWDVSRRQLRGPLPAAIEERDGFKRTISFPWVEVPERGRWEDVRVRDVRLGPADRETAQQWALDRYHRRVLSGASYLPASKLRALFLEVIEHTPLAEHRPTLPAHADLLRTLDPSPSPARQEAPSGLPQAERRTLYFRHAAVVDLAPGEVPEGQLALLVAGEAGSAGAPTARGSS
ncbi:hypothetical protein [Sorangium sp. So ce128]|uniref:hypothetical protein n=1 Tax=Sorangium sp. So ce128 TaxID=3133281 RepID=UPI003F5F0423